MTRISYRWHATNTRSSNTNAVALQAICQFRARLGKPTIAMSDAAPNSQFCANRVAPRRLSRRVVYRAATIFAATNCTECVDPASAPRAEKTSSRLTDKVVECHAHRLHNLALCLAIFLIVSYLCLLPPAPSLTLSSTSSSHIHKN